MAGTRNDDDKVGELTSGLDDLRTTVEELQVDRPAELDAGRLEAIRSALEQASAAADEIEEERDSGDPSEK